MADNVSLLRRLLAGYRLLVPAALFFLLGSLAFIQLVTERSGRAANLGWAALGFGLAAALMAVWSSSSRS